ncbi:MAG TPA: acyl-CoA dehydrogenase family protein, partial [Acidimicrobiales bacterium]|nr:acyl-CoA dehydrogenase family protein [Acidimicrobiales bacterium]
MDFDLSEDQLDLRKGAAALLDSLSGIPRVRAAVDAGQPDAELWAAMVDQGWTAVDTPVDDGGLGLGAVEMSVLCEEIGRHLAPAPFTGTVLAGGALRAALVAGAVPAERAVAGAGAGEWADRLSAGDAVSAVAWSTDAGAVQATRDGSTDAWVLSGRTDPVAFAPGADVLVVLATGEDGPGLFLTAGPAPAPEPAMDRTRPVARVVVEGAPAVRLGGDEAVQRLLDRAAAAVSAEMLGAADQVLAMTVQYAKDRVQFGRPIGSFQAVKHRCADMLVDVEGMRSAAYYAAWAVGAAQPDASAAASAAKVWCSDAARRVMASALQVHGGIGFTWEH